VIEITEEKEENFRSISIILLSQNLCLLVWIGIMGRWDFLDENPLFPIKGTLIGLFAVVVAILTSKAIANAYHPDPPKKTRVKA